MLDWALNHSIRRQPFWSSSREKDWRIGLSKFLFQHASMSRLKEKIDLERIEQVKLCEEYKQRLQYYEEANITISKEVKQLKEVCCGWFEVDYDVLNWVICLDWMRTLLPCLLPGNKILFLCFPGYLYFFL